MKKMKNIFKTIALVLFAGTTLVSCDLDLLPLDSIVVENYWKNKDDVENVLRSCYVGMMEDCISKMITWGEVRSDNVDVGQNVPLNLQQLIKGNLKQTNAACNWSSFYTVINRCNVVIDKSEQVKDPVDPNYTESDCRATQAEAKGLRALCYFYLIRTFKDVPYVKEPSYDDSQDFVIPVTPHEEILDDLIKDIEECKDQAVNKFPDEKKNSGRITRVALYSLLADMYLWRASDANLPQGQQEEYYRRAIQCADFVIKFKQNQYKVDEKGNLNSQMDSYVYGMYGYPLLAERQTSGGTDTPQAYKKIFEQGNSYESIFELTFGQNASDPKNTAVANMYGSMSSGTYTQYLTAATTLMNNKIESNAKNYSDQLLFPVTTDYRSLTSFRYSESGAYPILKYVMRFQTQNDFGNASTTWSAGIGNVQNSVVRDEQKTMGWIIYRLTDVMLIRAEAEIELAGLKKKEVAWNNWVAEDPENNFISTQYKSYDELDFSSAEQLYMDAFNIICAVYLRSNPIAQTQQTTSVPKLDSYTSYNGFVTLCENERHREFLFEGKRYYDLVRRARREGNTSHFAQAVSQKFGEASKAVLIKMSMMDFMYMPYLERELDVNPLLKQNPAYILNEDIVKN